MSSHRWKFGRDRVVTRRRLRVETLEDRLVPTTTFALRDFGFMDLIQFDSADPETILHSVEITGTQENEIILGFDVRPATLELYGLGITFDEENFLPVSGRIFVIDTTTGIASPVSEQPWATDLDLTPFWGFDFDPVTDQIRIVSEGGANYRVSPVTGQLIAQDADLSEETIEGIAYSNGAGFTTTTTLFGLSFDEDALVTIGGVDGDPSPNTGQVFFVGDTEQVNFDTINFDLEAGTDVGWATLGLENEDEDVIVSLFEINLTTGEATEVGPIGTGEEPIFALALAQTALTVGGTEGDDTLVVTATGPDSGFYVLNGGPVVPFAGITSFAFLGNGGNDTLTLLNPEAGLFAPINGIHFHGGLGGDLLQNLGGVADEGLYSPQNPSDGTVSHSLGALTQTIQFTGLEPIDDTVSEASFVVDASLATDVVNVVDGPIVSGSQTLEINSTSFETIRLANKDTVAINASEDADVLSLDFSLVAQGLTTLNVQAGGDDTIHVVSTKVTTNVNGDAGNDSIVFSNGATLSGGKADGGADVDTIDYGAYASSVAANLGLGTTGLSATLESSQEVPGNASLAQGTASFLNYDPIAKTFDLIGTVTALDPAVVTGFHLHRGAFGVNGPILIDLLPLALILPDGDGFTFSVLGASLATSLQGGVVNEAAFLGGLTYLNVHTAAFPGGMIRGQVFSNGNVNLNAVGTATGTGGVMNVENVVGGSAIDGLIGSAGPNQLVGNAGDDVLLGGPGADDFAGGNDNDVMIWSNGDGSDVMNGGVGIDRVQVNGALGGGALNDSFTMSANGTRLDFRRVSTGPFSLDVGTTETLAVLGIQGNDTFTVNDLTGVADLQTILLAGLQGDDQFEINAPQNVEVNVRGGSGDDTLRFADGATLGTGAFDGDTGINTLDYSAYSSGVAVNLGLQQNLIVDLDGTQENPAVVTTATGVGTISYDALARTLDVSLTVSDVALADVIGFHVHLGVNGVNGPVLVNLLAFASFVEDGANLTYNASDVPLPTAFEAAFLGGSTYLNLHVTAFPGGIIRGQIMPGANVNLTEGTATGTAGIRNVQNVVGGSGNDGLVGNSQVNVLRGGGGDDVIVGGPGADSFFGDEGDDTLVWSNGDGSDLMEGGSGSDTVQVNGGSGNDEFSLVDGAGRATFQRITPGPFTLDVGTTEILRLNTNRGNDQFLLDGLTTAGSGLTNVQVFGQTGDDLLTINDVTLNQGIQFNGNRGTNSLDVTNAVLDGATGAGVGVSGDGLLASFTNVQLSNSSFNNNANAGISLTHVGDVNLIALTTNGNGGAGLDVAGAGFVEIETGATGQLVLNDGVTFAAPLTYAVQIEGTLPGLEFDQLIALGPVILGNAELDLTFGFAPVEGDSFKLIDNLGVEAIDGTFAGLPEGAILDVAGLSYQITYQGGDGNDVVLTRVADVPVLTNVQIDDGNDQRSMVRRIVLTFSTALTASEVAAILAQLTVTKVGGGLVGFVGSLGAGGTQLTLRFTGPGIIGGSVADGRYEVKLNGELISSFHRLFGDLDGDADVDSTDAAVMNSIRNGTRRGFSPAYNEYLDFSGNGVISVDDRDQFRRRLGKTI